MHLAGASSTVLNQHATPTTIESDFSPPPWPLRQFLAIAVK
jgi:hypothetical protein